MSVTTVSNVKIVVLAQIVVVSSRISSIHCGYVWKCEEVPDQSGACRIVRVYSWHAVIDWRALVKLWSILV